MNAIEKVLKTLVLGLFIFTSSKVQAMNPFQARHATCLKEDSLLGFRPKPNCRGEFSYEDGRVVGFQLNSLGLWEKEMAPKAAKGVKRILLLGDSWLIPHENEKTITPYIEKKLGPIRAEIVNGGVSGYSLVQSYLFLPELLEHYNPEMVVVLSNPYSNALSTFYHHRVAQSSKNFSLGDIVRFWPIPRGFDQWLWTRENAIRNFLYSTILRELWLLSNNFFHKESISQIYEKYLFNISELVKRQGATAVVIQLDPFFPPRSNGKKSTITAYKAESFVENFWPWPIFTEQERLKIYENLNKKQIPTRNFSEDFYLSVIRNPEKYSLKNDMHFNAEGTKHLGEHMGELLKRYLVDAK